MQNICFIVDCVKNTLKLNSMILHRIVCNQRHSIAIGSLSYGRQQQSLIGSKNVPSEAVLHVLLSEIAKGSS